MRGRNPSIGYLIGIASAGRVVLLTGGPGTGATTTDASTIVWCIRTNLRGSLSDCVESRVCEHSKTEFNVLLRCNKFADVINFLDRYLGEWNLVSAPEEASILVLVPMDNGQFCAGDVVWANQIFDRDGSEARVYEFDLFEHKLKSLTRDGVNARASC